MFKFSLCLCTKLAEMGERKSYTVDEVKKHNTAESLWMIFDSKVYDLTDFLKEHPGGEEVLLDNGGTDATGVFTDVGHSEDAIEMREKYHIGYIVSEPVTTPPTTTTTSTTSSCCCGGSCGKWVKIAGVAVGVLAVLAIVYRKYK